MEEHVPSVRTQSVCHFLSMCVCFHDAALNTSVSMCVCVCVCLWLLACVFS